MKRRVVYAGIFLISLGFGLGLATYFRSISQAVAPKPVTALQPAESTVPVVES